MNVEDNLDMDDEDDKLEQVGSGSGGAAGSRKSGFHYPCRFCSDSFSSELQLILHFREEHLDPEEESLSEGDSDPDDNESEEGEEDNDISNSILDFVTDYERALLEEPEGGNQLNNDDEVEGSDETESSQRACPNVPACDKRRQLTGKLLPLLQAPEKAAPKERTKVTDHRRSHPSKTSDLKAREEETGRGGRPLRKPPRRAKTAAKKSIDKPKKLRSAPDKALYDCLFCDKSYSWPYKLEEHLRSHTKERPYFCKLCDQSFAVPFNLKGHMRSVHPTVTTFKCKLCSESFSNSKRLKNHMTSHSAERKFGCEHCEMRYYTKKDLTRHLISHSHGKGEYECDQCEKHFTRPDSLHTHMKIFHNIVRTIITKNKGNNFECQHCKARFSRKSELIGHIRATHPRPRPKEKKFQCEHCGARFTRNFDVSRHVRSVHATS